MKKRLSLDDIEKTLSSSVDVSDDLSDYEPPKDKKKKKKLKVGSTEEKVKKKKVKPVVELPKEKPKKVDTPTSLKPIQFNSSIGGDYSIFSNWFSCPFIAPCAITGKPRLYSCSEQYYMAHKLDPVACEQLIRKIYSTFDPSRMKYFGSEKGGATLHPEYSDEFRIAVMKKALAYKFTQNPLAAKTLISTGKADLIEFAPWDAFWGSGKDGSGENKLGKLLQVLRKKLRNNDIKMVY